jgi:hypothetical protein
MPSHSSKQSNASKTHTIDSVNRQTDHDQGKANACNPKRKRATCKKTRDPPLMLSDPIDSSSSDTKSFDVDDMYRSNSEVETINMRPFTKEEPRLLEDNQACSI